MLRLFYANLSSDNYGVIYYSYSYASSPGLVFVYIDRLKHIRALR